MPITDHDYNELVTALRRTNERLDGIKADIANTNQRLALLELNVDPQAALMARAHHYVVKRSTPGCLGELMADLQGSPPGTVRCTGAEVYRDPEITVRPSWWRRILSL